MSRFPTDPPPVDPLAVGPRPVDLAGVCDLAICRDAPVLIGLTATSEGLSLDREVTFEVPEDLLTIQIPPEWAGVALVADGTCRSIDRPEAPPIGRARFCFALTRAGESASLMITAEGSHRAEGVDAPIGHAVDVCHRLLDLATEPEPSPVLQLVHAEWLAELADMATAPTMAGLCDDWGLVASLHPYAHATRRQSPDALGRAAARHVEACTWAGIHTALVTAGGRFLHIPPAGVARLDGPSFARFALGARPPRSVSWFELCEILDPRILAKIRRTMAVAGDDVDPLPLVHRRFAEGG